MSYYTLLVDLDAAEDIAARRDAAGALSYASRVIDHANSITVAIVDPEPGQQRLREIPSNGSAHETAISHVA